MLDKLLEAAMHPIVLTAALALGVVGEVVKNLVRAKAGDKGWKGVFYVTLPAHGFVVSVLIFLLPFMPVVPPFEADIAGRLFTGALAGVVNKVAYDLLVSTVRRAIGNSKSGTDA